MSSTVFYRPFQPPKRPAAGWVGARWGAAVCAAVLLGAVACSEAVIMAEIDLLKAPFPPYLFVSLPLFFLLCVYVYVYVYVSVGVQEKLRRRRGGLFLFASFSFSFLFSLFRRSCDFNILKTTPDGFKSEMNNYNQNH